VTDPRLPPLFIGGALAIDFLNSLATPVDTPVEWIASGEDLLEWLSATQAVPQEALTSLRHTAPPGDLDAVATQARALREWFRGFVDKHRGRPLRPEVIKELAPLNRILGRDQEYGQIVSSEGGRRAAAPAGLIWRPMRRWQAPDALLLPLARAMADLVCNEDFAHIKRCEGAMCTLFFVDRTRARARRWCAMAVCGNRAKQAAHRQRGHPG
jgi:predicted RNA-binding Zn ribbon-like protein